MFGTYAIARARGAWLAKHPASPGHTPQGNGYRCAEDGCGRTVVRRDSARSGWAHAPKGKRRGAHL